MNRRLPGHTAPHTRRPIATLARGAAVVLVVAGIIPLTSAASAEAVCAPLATLDPALAPLVDSATVGQEQQPTELVAADVVARRAPVLIDTIPVETIPVDTVPVDTVPVETVSVDTIPVRTHPIDTIPTATVPAPIDTIPIDTLPVPITTSPIIECPPTPTPTAPAPTTYYSGPTFFDARPKVVTLGDSYSSGTGIWKEDSSYDEQFGGVQPTNLRLTGRSDNECWREFDSTPGPRRAAATNSRSIFLACKGAEFTHLQDQLTVLQGQWPTDASAMWSGSSILLTGGGNDIRTRGGEDWPELLQRCITELNPFRGCHQKSDNQVNNWASIASRSQAFYNRVAQSASGAEIRVMGYPRLMTPGSSSCPNVTGVTRNEARWIDEQVDTLNSILSASVGAARATNPGVDIEFVSVTSYLTVGACYGQSSYAHVNDRVVAWSGSGVLLTSDASFHPKQLGYDRYYDAFVASL